MKTLCVAYESTVFKIDPLKFGLISYRLYICSYIGSFGLKNAEVSNLFVLCKISLTAVQAVFLPDTYTLKLTIFRFVKLYRELTTCHAFFAQQRDEDCLRQFCGMGRVSNGFALR